MRPILPELFYRRRQSVQFEEIHTISFSLLCDINEKSIEPSKMFDRIWIKQISMSRD